MAEGGFFRGNANRPSKAEQESENMKITRYPALLWGKLTGEPSILADRGSIKVEFVVKFGASRNVTKDHKEGSGWRKCEAWGADIAMVLSACEKGETVLCLGEWRQVKYAEGNKNRKGKQKEDYHVFRVHAAYPMSFMNFLVKLYASPSLRKLIEKDALDAPDPFESAEDGLDF